MTCMDNNANPTFPPTNQPINITRSREVTLWLRALTILSQGGQPRNCL